MNIIDEHIVNNDEDNYIYHPNFIQSLKYFSILCLLVSIVFSVALISFVYNTFDPEHKNTLVELIAFYTYVGLNLLNIGLLFFIHKKANQFSKESNNIHLLKDTFRYYFISSISFSIGFLVLIILIIILEFQS